MKRIKKFEDFINESYIDSNSIESYLTDYVEAGEKIDLLKKSDKYGYIEMVKERWKLLIEIIKNYYKKQLKSTFESKGKEETIKLFDDIKKSLQRDERYESKTGVVMFDLTEFTRNLIK